MSKKSYTLLEYLVTIDNKLNKLLKNGEIDNGELLTEINNLKVQFDNIVNEIEQARDGNVNLNTRLNNFNTQLTTISQRLDNISNSSGSGSTLNEQQIDERINLKLTTQYKANPIEPLNIITSYVDGDNQPTHPSVKFFPESWNGHKYWMGYTPYPNSNDAFENPCITYSDDGIKWSEEGISNPIQNKPSNGYNSDTHLVVNNNVLECWWREVNGSITYIKRKKSSDGIAWGDEETLFNAGLLDALSPVVIYDEGKYKIWVVYRRECLKYYESNDGANWQYIRDINVTTLEPNWKVWHIDIIRNENGEYEFVGCYQNNGEFDQNNFIFYAKSKDNITYSIPIKILGNGYPDNFDDLELYRPCLCIDERGNYKMYYGAQKTGKIWSIGLVTCRDIASLNNLLVGQNSVIEKMQSDINELYKLLESGDVVTVPVTSVTLDKTNENLVIGKSLQLTATIEPQGATNKTVTWSSSNDSIATVSNTGLVSALAEGEVTITCTSNSNPNAIATCTIKSVQAGSDLASLVYSLKASNYTDGSTWIETVNNNNASITGTVTKNETEVLFTGNKENYFESDVSSLGIGTGSFALEWYGTLSGGSGECIIAFGNTSSWGDSIILYNLSSSNIKIDAGAGESAQQTVSCTNEKHKIILNYDTTTNDFVIYVDNLANKSTTNDVKFGVNKNLLTNKSASLSFIGGVEYIKIYNKFLSNDEIKSLLSN